MKIISTWMIMVIYLFISSLFLYWLRQWMKLLKCMCVCVCVCVCVMFCRVILANLVYKPTLKRIFPLEENLQICTTAIFESLIKLVPLGMGWSLGVRLTWSGRCISYGVGFPDGTRGKEPTCQCRRHKRLGLIPGLERSPGGWNGNPCQYSCLENP